MTTRRLLLLLAGSPLSAYAQTMVFAVPDALSMPLADIRGEVVTGGILKDIGDAIAANLHRQPRFVLLPRKRISGALANGTVDAYCYARADWFKIDSDWSRPLIPNSFVVVSAPGVAAPKSIASLGDETIGTVYGYEYPDIESGHIAYRRDDAPSVSLNVKKLLAGRFRYAALDGLSLRYVIKTTPELRKLAVLTVSSFATQCAWSHKSAIPLNELNRATDALAESGGVEQILDKYK